MNISFIKLKRCLNNFQQPSQKLIQQFLSTQHNIDTYIIPINLLKEVNYSNINYNKIKQYLSEFISSFITITGQLCSMDEKTWYVFYLLLLSQKDLNRNAQFLYLDYKVLPEIQTNSKFFKYIQYQTYISMMPVLFSINASSEAFNKLALQLEKTTESALEYSSNI